MFPTRITRPRTAIGFWPFNVPGTPPVDPLSCLAQWPNYTWNSQSNQCVSTATPGSAGSSVMQYMMLACKQLPSCQWDYSRNICSCASSSGIADQTTGKTSECPAGTYQLPASIPGYGNCMPVSGPGIPQIPGIPGATQGGQTSIPSGTVTAGGQQVTVQPVEEKSWWQKRSDGEKAAIIGGAVVAGIGALFLLKAVAGGGGSAPAIVYTSGQPMRANKKRISKKSRRNEFWFLSDGQELGEKEMWNVVDGGGFVYVLNTGPSGSARWSVYHGRPYKAKLGYKYLPALMHKSLSAGDVPKKVLSAAGR